VGPSPRSAVRLFPFFYWGIWFVCFGLSLYFLAILTSIARLIVFQPDLLVAQVEGLLWVSGLPTTIGLGMIAIDLGLMLPSKRRSGRPRLSPLAQPAEITVALTAYNDEASIFDAVRDFSAHQLVRRVIVVSNNSTDQTMARASEAGAIVVNEPRQGYGACVYRCLQEALSYADTSLVALCEGDMTFRAGDLDKFMAYLPHADVVNGTRIVEQLRDYDTQLTTFMYYGNFFVGKLLEAKHLGRGTFTDVGTTYKVIRRDALAPLMPELDPRVNLEFNAHFLDKALLHGLVVVECPITFHARVGVSKGGNASNLRALKVGLGMLAGLSFDWRIGRR
jgi:glycosyltransferase involved in cell wall biosynthesis